VESDKKDPRNKLGLVERNHETEIENDEQLVCIETIDTQMISLLSEIQSSTN